MVNDTETYGHNTHQRLTWHVYHEWGPLVASYYFHNNHLNSPIAISEPTGNVLEYYTYSPYGERRVFDDSWSDTGGSVINNPIGHSGLFLLAGDHLYHNLARAYDARIGCFLQRDPIGYDDGMNTYQGIGSRPHVAVDMWMASQPSVHGCRPLGSAFPSRTR